jgi:uncharacterized damage-inducible protein DinB
MGRIVDTINFIFLVARTAMSHAQLIAEYLAGPQKLRAAVTGMNAEQMDATPTPGKWSTRQVICHIADFEPVYVDRMKRVIAENEPRLMSGDPDLFAARLAYAIETWKWNSTSSKPHASTWGRSCGPWYHLTSSARAITRKMG